MDYMDISEVRKLIHHELTETRYEHTLRVAETATMLADLYDAPQQEIMLAALLHDLAKCKPIAVLRQAIETYQLPSVLLTYHHELWHGPVAAKMVEEMLGIHDRDILNAIYYHTTGRAQMSQIELIVFVADYIEPGRSFPGVAEVRTLANENLMLAARTALKNTINFLMKKDALIYPDTFHAYNDLTRKLGVNND